MPSASTSTLRMPSRSRSSLSHSITVRSSMAAFSMGTSSSSGPRVMTKPPTCWERWRGKPMSSAASSRVWRSRGASGSRPSSLHPRRLQPAAAPAPDGAGQARRRVSSGKPHGLADLAQRRAAAIADHRGGKPGALAAVFLVDVLDHLLAPLMLEIDVDVRRLVARGADEALEQQIDVGGIDGGDAEAIADGGIGGRAAALAEDVLRAGEAHESWTVRK